MTGDATRADIERHYGKVGRFPPLRGAPLEKGPRGAGLGDSRGGAGVDRTVGHVYNNDIKGVADKRSAQRMVKK